MTLFKYWAGVSTSENMLSVWACVKTTGVPEVVVAALTGALVAALAGVAAAALIGAVVAALAAIFVAALAGAGAGLATAAAAGAVAIVAAATLLFTRLVFTAGAAAGAGASISPSATSTKVAGSSELLSLVFALEFHSGLMLLLLCTEEKPGKFIEYVLSFSKHRANQSIPLLQKSSLQKMLLAASCPAAVRIHADHRTCDCFPCSATRKAFN